MQITLTDRQSKTVRTALRDMYKAITENGLGDTERGRMAAAGWMKDIADVLGVMDANTRSLPEEMGDAGRKLMEIDPFFRAGIRRQTEAGVPYLEALEHICYMGYEMREHNKEEIGRLKAGQPVILPQRGVGVTYTLKGEQ